MKVEFYGHVRQYQNIKAELDANINQVLMSGKYVLGPLGEQFEKELAQFTGHKHAIGVGNGTDAIWLVLMALGIGPGDEVITHPNTFFATAEAVWIAGATVVFVDCDATTRCIDPAKIEAAITPRTKAIIPVHLYGQCADMPAIWKIAEKHHLKVIEDNAQGIDADGGCFKQGDRSAAVTTSFIIQKNLGCFGDGGAVYTNDSAIDARVRKLKHLKEYSHARIKWAARYTAGLKGAKGFTLPTAVPGYRHVWHLYALETKDAAKRDGMVDFLVKNGVDAKTHYSIPIHKQEGYPWGKGARIVGSVAQAEKNAASVVTLPMFPELTAEEVDYVIAKVMEWDKANA
jgi:dTDP-4-amino-4,6-dideoxygalactose transaminase